MHMRGRAVLWIPLLGLVLLFGYAACGGGGGSGAAPGLDASTFSGTYFWASLTATDESPATDVASGQWGTAVADGAGSMTVNLRTNESGSIMPPGMATVPYTVATDGTWVWRATGVEFTRGGISSDGRIAGGTSLRTGLFPQINLLIRREGTWSTASLNGTYHMC